MNGKKPPKQDDTENLPSEEKIKLLLHGARIHVNRVLDDRIARQKAITSTLQEGRRWELESLLNEIIKFQFVRDVLDALLHFL